MTPIQQEAAIFARALGDRRLTNDGIVSLLTKALSPFKKNSDKLELLAEIQNQISIKYKEHTPHCTDPANCVVNKIYDTALFFASR